MSGSPAAPFHSLSEAIARVGKSATFLLMQNRDQVTSSENISKEAIVFYKDDLDFLRGIAEVSIPTGIDEGSNIQLLFLCKVIYEKKIDVKIDLQESPDIKFDKIKNRLHDDIYIKQEIHIDDKQKSFLTPFKIQAYMGQNTIFLAWEKPKSPKYKGVRIFRSVQKDIDHQTHPGEELYDGPGDTHKLRCKFTYRTPEAPPASFHRQMADSEPPPRKGEHILVAPSGLRISGFESEITGDELSYYADISVSPDIAYIYTIWTYSDNNTYGYPITINVSLSDASSENTCYQAIPSPIRRG